MGDRKVVRESESVKQDWYANHGDSESRQQTRDRSREGQHGGGCGCCSCGCAPKFQEEIQRDRYNKVDQSQRSWRTDENTRGSYEEGYRRGYETARAENQACFERRRTQADDICNPNTKMSRLTYEDRDRRYTPLYQTTHEIARQRVMEELQRRQGILPDGDRNCQPHVRPEWQRNSWHDKTESQASSNGEGQYQQRYQDYAYQRDEAYRREQEYRRQQEYRRNVPEGCFPEGQSDKGKERARRIAAIVGSIVFGGQNRIEYNDRSRQLDDFYEPTSNHVGSSGCQNGVRPYSQWSTGQQQRTNPTWEMHYPNEWNSGRRDKQQSWEMQQAEEQFSGRFRSDGSPRFPRHNGNPGMFQSNRQNFPGAMGFDPQYSESGEHRDGYPRSFGPATEQERKAQQMRQLSDMAAGFLSKFNR